MAKKTYIGINDTARKVKKFYIGVNGVARKIKKMYIGIAGIARQFFGGSAVVNYYGASELSYSRIGMDTDSLAGGSVDEYAIFAGGSDYGYTKLSAVDCFDSNLTHTLLDLTVATNKLNAAASANKLYLTGGGTDNENGTGFATNTYCIDSNLTLTQNNNPIPRYSMGTTKFDNKAVFGGGYQMTRGTSQPETFSQIYTLNDSGTLTQPASLSQAAGEICTTTIGQNILFGGGCYCTNDPITSDGLSDMQVYNTSWTKITATNLSSPRENHGIGLNVDSYAMFVSGTNSGGSSLQTVEVYNISLTKSIATSTTYKQFGAAAKDGVALIGGGRDTSNNQVAVVEMYDSSLTKTTLGESLSTARRYSKAVSTSKQIVFGGGMGDATNRKTVDAFNVG